MVSHSVLETGTVIGHLTLKQQLPDLGADQQWLVECFCGAFAVWTAERLRWVSIPGRGLPKVACTTCHVKAKAKRNGYSHRTEYHVWKAAYARCHRENFPFYSDYGGRGINMHSSWWPQNDGFPKFLAHVGDRPSSDYSLDRIDNDGNYEPGNVRWATKREQMNNRRITRTWWIDELLGAVIGRFGFWADFFAFATTFTEDQSTEAFLGRIERPPATFLFRVAVARTTHRSDSIRKQLKELPYTWTVEAPWKANKRGPKNRIHTYLGKKEATTRFNDLMRRSYLPLLAGAAQ
jgi:hypothetical protein